ncbi:MAG TPA: PQQ-binding-like beta-propeller repeat protein [Pirellulales bacterium]|nr:PQQ-binding-like beta-propeller repeat protein [Pirellulales bacterium]
MRLVRFVLCALLAIQIQATSALAVKPTNDWPTFRGNGRTAVSQETGLLQEWPEGGPPLVWETEGSGRGYASLAIAGDRIITLGDVPQEGVDPAAAPGTDEFLLCYDRATGKPVWQTKVGPAWNEGKPDWQSSRSTPTIDGDLVYALTAQGDLYCCQTATGKVKWHKNLKSDFGGTKGDNWGYSESPLVDGPNVVVTPGGETTTMIALNKLGGKPVWSCVRPGDRGAGHSSIVISEIGKTRVYVQDTASGAMGVRAKDGKLLWSYEIDKTTAVIPTPIIRDDLVFFTAGYKRGGALLKQVPAANGDVKVEEIYPLNPKLANKHGGIVLVGDYLYGDSDDQGIIFCADLMTGEQKWQSRGPGSKSASIAAADGCLYIHYSSGVMCLAKASPESFQELGHFTIPGSGERPSWAHPVIVGGRMYLRENGRILCYDVQAK